MSVDTDERARVAERAARAGAEVAHATFRTDVQVETKDGKTDVVTQADRDAQRAVVDAIREAYPGEVVVGEEEGTPDTVPESGAAWVVDPIDGSNNYVRGIRTWATSVAAVLDGDPVAGATVMPAVGDAYVVGPEGPRRNGEPIATSDRADPETWTVAPTYWWGYDRREEYAAACRAVVDQFGDLRRFGCAQASLAMVADGALEGTFTTLAINPWDAMVGAALVRAAGGVVTDLDGEPWRHDSGSLVASSGEAHDVLLDAVGEI